LFEELSLILNRKGFLVNRLELTFPGKDTILTCEVLSKSSRSGKEGENKFSALMSDLEVVSMKLKPFFGNRKVCLRITCLDGLFFQKSLINIEKGVLDALRGKKLGTGLIFLVSDLIRVVCLAMYLPVAGFFVQAYLNLVKKSPGHRGVFEHLMVAFQVAFKSSESFRRLRGLGVQVKGRYNISNDRSQRWDIRFGAVSLSSMDVLMD
jgi:hypothetical protein